GDDQVAEVEDTAVEGAGGQAQSVPGSRHVARVQKRGKSSVLLRTGSGGVNAWEPWGRDIPAPCLRNRPGLALGRSAKCASFFGRLSSANTRFSGMVCSPGALGREAGGRLLSVLPTSPPTGSQGSVFAAARRPTGPFPRHKPQILPSLPRVRRHVLG